MRTRILNIIIALAAILTSSVACQTEDLLLPEGSLSKDGFINLRMDMPRVFEKNSPHYEKARVAFMPQELTARLLVWSRHVMEHMLRTYGCLDA